MRITLYWACATAGQLSCDSGSEMLSFLDLHEDEEAGGLEFRARPGEGPVEAVFPALGLVADAEVAGFAGAPVVVSDDGLFFGGVVDLHTAVAGGDAGALAVAEAVGGIAGAGNLGDVLLVVVAVPKFDVSLA